MKEYRETRSNLLSLFALYKALYITWRSPKVRAVVYLTYIDNCARMTIHGYVQRLVKTYVQGQLFKRLFLARPTNIFRHFFTLLIACRN